MRRHQRHSDEAKRKIGDAIRKALANPEARARMSASAKRQWADPETRARIRAAMRKAWSDPAVRARLRPQGLPPLPPMTPAQRRLYKKLSAVLGRDAALADVFRADIALPD
jgi:tripartite-type tricarboxylate transporter receptor subunit TctC